MIPRQRLDTAVIGGLCFLGKETAWNAFVMIPVVGHARTAFSVPGTIIGAGAVALIVTVLYHIRFFLSVVDIRIVHPARPQNPL